MLRDRFVSEAISYPRAFMNRRNFVKTSMAVAGGVAATSFNEAVGAGKTRRSPERKFHVKQLANDGDNNAFFPSAAGGKLLGSSDGTTLLGYATQKGSAIWQRRDHAWLRGATLPIQRPYLVEDQQGFLHAFGLEDRGHGQEIWHYTARRPHAIADFDDGERVYQKNYSAAAVGDNGTLYYFGAGLDAVVGFREKTRGGEWSRTRHIISGTGIYPGVVCRGNSMHLIFCGWNGGPALYEGVYYIRSNDRGATWCRSDDRMLQTPVDWRSGELELLNTVGQSNSKNPAGGEANTHPLNLLVDQANRPHVLYWFSRPYFIAFGTGSGHEAEPNVRVRHLRRDGDGWKSSLLCEELDRDVSYACLAEDDRGTLHAVMTHKRSNDAFFDLGYAFSEDAGDTWSAIQSLTNDANQRKLSYAHVAINPVARHRRVQFACNMWSKKNPSPIWYGEIEID